MTEINPAWIDVSPPENERFCLPRTDRLGAAFPVYEDAVGIIPRSEWPAMLAEKGRAMRPLVQKIKNQKQEGTCASNACGQGGEVVLVKQFGPEHWVELSAVSLYKRVAPNAQSGSTINDNIREISARGILPADTPANRKLVEAGYFKHVHPAVGFSVPLPAGWEETAKLFRVPEWFDVRSFEGFVSAILRGAPVFYGRASHAILGVWAVIDQGRLLIEYANSWDVTWGDQGFGYDSESFISGAISSYGAVAPRSVTLWRPGLMPAA